ncbi:MAG: c-type cytochrome [Flavobacteriales bacterium]|nr:MAG: c-type cytochrome [Flavobacteriales bacterium]
MPLPACISRRSIGSIRTAFALFLSLSFTAAHAQPADAALYAQGEKLFKGNCASCHKVDAKMTGPAIQGARARWEGQGDIYAWIKNSAAYLKTGNAYATKLFEDWKKVPMPAQALTDAEIDAILYYADNYQAPKPPTPPGGETAAGGGAAPERGENNWVWLLVLALLFLVVGLSLSGVKRSLANAVNEAEGRGPLPETTRMQRFRAWAWEHKVFMSFVGLFVTVWLVLQAWDALWVVGVYGGDEVEHYKPEQPILFNHTLHAGKVDKGNLGINCQYCHSSAEKSKHAGIPSANVCMNCHTAVAQGRSEAGTKEIAKIYAAVGWDPDKGEYTGKEEPVRWVKVHNLPDHAYFNHAQHVAVGKLECQECHGPIDEKMDVAEQWAPLTMGWCIQCHNEREVKMAGNGYYDEVMARLHEDEKLGHRELKQYLEDGKITVKELGGWECAKCHY